MIQIFPEGIDLNDFTKVKEYELVKGSLISKKEDDNYTLKLESTLETGKKIEIYYHGKIN